MPLGRKRRPRGLAADSGKGSSVTHTDEEASSTVLLTDRLSRDLEKSLKRQRREEEKSSIERSQVNGTIYDRFVAQADGAGAEDPTQHRQRKKSTPAKRHKGFSHTLSSDDESDSSEDLDFELARTVAKASVPKRLARDDLLDRHGKGQKIEQSTDFHLKPRHSMTERDWRMFRDKYALATRGHHDLPRPMRTWQDGHFIPDRLLDLLIRRHKYLTPTPIQMAAIPIALKGVDMIGLAQTGSGKTVAFILPLLIRMFMDSTSAHGSNRGEESLGPIGLVLAPTRELAQQITMEAEKFTHSLKLTVVTLVGGQDRQKQIQQLQDSKSVDIVVATPGRLKDLLEDRYLVLTRTSYVVLDEADRMIDMGFEADVKAILEFIPREDNTGAETNGKARTSVAGVEEEGLEYPLLLANGKDSDVATSKRVQTVMFTATMPPKLHSLALTYLEGSVTVTVGQRQGAGGTADTVVQNVEMLSSKSVKRQRLSEIVEEYVDKLRGRPIMIFVNQRNTVDPITETLSDSGFHAAGLHGGMEQSEREQIMRAVKQGKLNILIGTDVLGRGIDIKDVGLVINYDLPKSIQDYTHRIGRTGRAGRRGKAITLVTEDDSAMFYDLRRVMERSENSRCPMWLSRHGASQVPNGAAVQPHITE
eukprot:Clim_evm2s17 gene=Clim_evmTU2s17